MKSNYEQIAAEKLFEIKQKGFYRKYPEISQIAGESPYGLNHKTGEKVIIFGNNNYLGLSQNEQIKHAKIEAIKEHGAGSSGTRNILGTSKILADLELKISRWQGTQASLSFISALDANIGTLSALGKNFNDTIFLSDEKNHASIIDGIKLSGKAKYIFRHNDIDELESKLREIRSISDSRSIVIVVESLYSMEGDFAPLKKLIELKSKYDALLFVDEVHATGVFGKSGAGYAEHIGLHKDIDVTCGTFAKAMGVTGGFISASKNMIDLIRHTARNFIFTTSPSPDVASACLKSIEVVSSSEGRNLRVKLFDKVEFLKSCLKKSQIEFIENQSQIVPIVFGDEIKTSLIAKDLMEEFYFAVTPIFYPTVEVGKARIRINVTPNHTEKMIIDLVGAIKKLEIKYADIDTKSVAENDNFCDKDSVNKGIKQ